MAYLLARLDELTDGGKRRVWFRGKSHEGLVSGDAATLSTGTIVFLESEHPPWDRARKARLEPWPPQVEVIQRLRASPHQRITVADIGGQLTSYGPSTIDDRGFSCGVAFGRLGGKVQIVLNYSGWTITELGRAEYEVLSYNCGGDTVWVLPHTLTILAKSEAHADKENKPWPPQHGLLAELYNIVPAHSVPAGAEPAGAPSSSLANLVGAAGSPAPPFAHRVFQQPLQLQKDMLLRLRYHFPGEPVRKCLDCIVGNLRQRHPAEHWLEVHPNPALHVFDAALFAFVQQPRGAQLLKRLARRWRSDGTCPYICRLHMVPRQRRLRLVVRRKRRRLALARRIEPADAPAPAWHLNRS